MIESGSTLESNYWFGAQGNRLWIGQVEGDGNIDIYGKELYDISESNRVKVRIMGYHARSRKTLPPKDLPWASVMLPTDAPSLRNAGAIHGLDIGAWVIGTFLDGESAQQPLVMGSLGIVEKGQNYSERIDDLGLSNNLTPRRPETATNNKPGGSGNNGVSNRGKFTGKRSNNDTQQSELEKVTFSVANAKCGQRPESEFARILNDLFSFVRKNDRIGSSFVDKTTGSITNTLDLVQTYVSRLGAVANGMLGDIKQLILYEIKRYAQKYVITPLITALALKPEKNPETIWATSKVLDTLLEIIKCLFSTILDKLLNFLLDVVLGIIDDLINAAFCVVSDIIKGIVAEVTNAISLALTAIKTITNIIKLKGDFAGGILSMIGEYISQFCDGNLSCFLGIGEYTTKEGETPDNTIETFLNRVEVFGSLDNDLEVGLFGSDSFFSTFESTRIIAGDGTVQSGTLNCSKANKTLLPAFPNVYFTGYKGGKPDGVPKGVPVVNSFGEVIGINITNPGTGITRIPNVTVKSYAGYGSNAEGTVIVEDGQVKDVVITNTGGGYPYFDGSVTNSTVPTDSNGDPDFDKIYGIHAENPTWIGIITTTNPPVVTNAGEGLDESCQIVIEAGDNEVNEVVFPKLKPVIVNGRLISVDVVQEGFGFTALPKIYLSCSRSAVIRPVLKYIPRKNAKDYLNLYDQYVHIIDCVGHPGDA